MDAPRGSPGADAGLVGCIRTKDGQVVLGDLITKVNGSQVKTAEDLLAMVEEVELGSVVELTVAKNSNSARIEQVSCRTVDRAQLART